MAIAHLNLEGRIELEVALRAGDTWAMIATRLGLSTGTINPVVELIGGPRSYRGTKAHREAQVWCGVARRGDCAIEEHKPL
jgi:hypothetical protein